MSILQIYVNGYTGEIPEICPESSNCEPTYKRTVRLNKEYNIIPSDIDSIAIHIIDDDEEDIRYNPCEESTKFNIPDTVTNVHLVDGKDILLLNLSTTLTSLTICNNALIKHFLQCVNLEQLNIHIDSLEGEVEFNKNISKFTKLRNLRLQGINNIDISNLPQLHVLYVSSNFSTKYLKIFGENERQ